jgi:5-methylcytosine-specific restriction endonuclease McrA
MIPPHNETRYAAYIQSHAWRSNPARLAELVAAGHRCRLCYVDSGLTVHHRTYARLGHETTADLTALCAQCHAVVTDMLRRRRYAIRPPRYADTKRALEYTGTLIDPTRG